MREFSEATLEAIAERLKVLAEPNRLRLLNLLRDGELSVGELTEAVETSQANVSRHLGLLRRHGFVEREKDGVVHRYRIADPTVFRLCDLVCGTLETKLEERRRVLAGED